MDHDVKDVSQDAERQRKEQLVARLAAMREQGLIKRGEVLDPMQKALANPRSPKMAIRAMCWQCEGGFADPGVRQRVGACAKEGSCPLWPHRPWQKKSGQSSEMDDDDLHEDAETELATTEESA